MPNGIAALCTVGQCAIVLGIMVKIAIVYMGKLRCEAQHQPSSSTTITDAPCDNHGLGESFSPTDLVATALGTCMLTIMGIVASKKQIAVEGATIAVQKSMLADPERRISALALELVMPAGIPVEARAELEDAAKTCPVMQSIDPRIEVTTKFRYLEG